MASSFGYSGMSYTSNYSDDGLWNIDITVTYTHTSPTDGKYRWAIHYWYNDITENGTMADFNIDRPNVTISSPFLVESAGSHSDQRSHNATINVDWKAGHTYQLGLAILYNVNDEKSVGGAYIYTESNLGYVNQTINVKAANEQGGGSSGTNSITITNKVTYTDHASVSFRCTPADSTAYHYVVSWGTTSSCSQGTTGNYPSSGSYTSRSGTINITETIPWNYSSSTLSSGTLYYFRVDMLRDTDNSVLATVTDTFTTESSGGGGGTTPSVSEIEVEGVSITTNSITLEVTIYPSEYGYYYRPWITYSTQSSVDYEDYDGDTVKGKGSISLYEGPWSSSEPSSYTWTMTLSGLEPGTKYYLKAYVIRSEGNTSNGYLEDEENAHSGKKNFTTLTEYNGTVTVTSSYANSNEVTVTATFRGDGNNTSSWNAYPVCMGTGGSRAGSPTYYAISAGDTTAHTWTWTYTGLLYETTYTFTVAINNGTGASAVEVCRASTTVTTGPEPSQNPTLYEWTWENSGGICDQITPESSAAQRQAARLSVQSDATLAQRATTNFHHTVWNDIITWLVWNLTALGENDSSTTSNASTAKMTASPYYLTASKWNAMVALWNQLEDAIESGGSMTMVTKSTGDTVWRTLFVGQNAFITYMNNTIDNYNLSNSE